jgi:hypothetical protein
VHKAGVAAFQSMLDALAEGCSIALSADVPKVASVAGLGIIKLAQASGRPIYPSAIATSRRVVLDNWDRTTINLPFGRVAADPLSVSPDADEAELDAARRVLEERLNAATRRAYELVDINQCAGDVPFAQQGTRLSNAFNRDNPRKRRNSTALGPTTLVTSYLVVHKGHAPCKCYCKVGHESANSRHYCGRGPPHISPDEHG